MNKIVKSGTSFKLKNSKFSIYLLLVIFILNIQGCSKNQPAIKDLKYFLNRMYTLDHLPELEDSHTAMSSTWDTTGGNNDGTCFKNIQGKKNILLDADGPGCIHRIFTGRVFNTDNTKIQVYIDNKPQPVYDMEVIKFFSPNGPFPYPLVFEKTYPGILFPIPFEKHCKIQLVNEEATNWGNYWQIVYTKYSADVKVKSLGYPLNRDEQKALDNVCQAWLKAEYEPPQPPLKWTIDRNIDIDKGQTAEMNYEGGGVLREMRIAVSPNNDEIMQNTRMKIKWDGLTVNSVDVPLGYFFGNADYQNQKQFSSLLLGINEKDIYSRFPMPFGKGFIISFENQSEEKIENLQVRIDVEEMKRLPENWGYFHATWNEILLDSLNNMDYPRFGKSSKPFLVLLDVKNVRGKYVGNLYHVAWPYKTWWGEGDWLIWSDEASFPPSYHGTGSEEYFNSGWGNFDRKAISGFITKRPGNVYDYSFHLNDHFQFQQNLKVTVEIFWLGGLNNDYMVRSIYGSTAFWYAFPAQDAGSKQTLISPRLEHNTLTGEFKWE
jgi:hypothetical protein